MLYGRNCIISFFKNIAIIKVVIPHSRTRPIPVPLLPFQLRSTEVRVSRKTRIIIYIVFFVFKFNILSLRAFQQIFRHNRDRKSFKFFAAWLESILLILYFFRVLNANSFISSLSLFSCTLGTSLFTSGIIFLAIGPRFRWSKFDQIKNRNLSVKIVQIYQKCLSTAWYAGLVKGIIGLRQEIIAFVGSCSLIVHFNKYSLAVPLD